MCRRPIGDHEVLYLRAFGIALRQDRQRAGLTQAALGRGAALGERHIRDLEYGRRRPRRSTLHRLANALVTADRTSGPFPDEVVARWVALAGLALAEESGYSQRVDRRRRRRVARAARHSVVVHTVSYLYVHLGIAERHVHQWHDGARRQRRRVYYRLRGPDGQPLSPATRRFLN